MYYFTVNKMYLLSKFSFSTWNNTIEQEILFYMRKVAQRGLGTCPTMHS